MWLLYQTTTALEEQADAYHVAGAPAVELRVDMSTFSGYERRTLDQYLESHPKPEGVTMERWREHAMLPRYASVCIRVHPWLKSQSILPIEK